jgi:anti-sigma regulatory factor (Ser/Thr protein kinase)
VDPSQKASAVTSSDPGAESERAEVPLPQDLTAPGVARSAARRLLDRWRLQDVLEPVLLTVSELVTNALRHGRPPVALRLEHRGSAVTVDVHDGSREPPGDPTAEQSDGAESGRGLGIVEAMAAETGVEKVPDDGKSVWARFEPERPDG